MAKYTHPLIFLVISAQLFTAAPCADAKQPAAESLPAAVIEAEKLLKNGRLDEGESALASYLLTNRGDIVALLLHADALYRLGRYHYAAEEAEAALKIQPNSSDAIMLVGKIYQQLKRPAQAAAMYQRYFACAPPTDSQQFQAQYKTLIGVLQDEAKEHSEKFANDRKQCGDYLNAVSAGGGGLHKWKEPTAITVHITDGRSVTGYRPEFEESLRQAFDEWTDLSGDMVKFVFVTDPAQAKMQVKWTDDLHAPALKAESGVAHVKLGANGIESAEISLLTVDPFKDGPIGKNYLYNVCLHEIGHALGLGSHSPHTDDIMYPQLNKQQGLSPRDINTLIALYCKSAEQAESMPYVDEWGRPLTPAAKAERLMHEGTAAAMAGQYKKAIEKLESALEINPKNDLARQNLAVAANNLAISSETTPEAAVALLRKALKWNPDSEISKKNLEIFLQRTQQH